MATANNPHALEGYLRTLMMNAAEAVHQLREGTYPQYEMSCRRNLGDILISIAFTREKQLNLDPNYPIGSPVQIAGLREADLPGAMALGDLRRVRRFVCVPVD